MTLFEFGFLAEGLPSEDTDPRMDGLLDLIDEFEAVLSWHRGVSRIDVSVDGYEHCVAAAGWIIGMMAPRLAPGRLLRLDPDLVGCDDIVTRVYGAATSSAAGIEQRRTFRVWRAEESFPRPEGTVNRNEAYRWGEVNAWLIKHGLPGDPDVVYPTREEELRINMMLLIPQLPPAVDERHADGRRGVWWVHCSPALIELGVDCGTAPRRACTCPFGGSHDHQVLSEVVLALPDQQRDGARWEPAPLALPAEGGGA